MTLFVSNLHQNATEKDLEQLFSSFGDIKSIEIMTDFVTHRSRGCAYVQMTEDVAALRAIEKLNNTQYMKKSLGVTEKGPRRNFFKSRP